MRIFQPDRYLLQKQIKDASHYISGRTLDVGAGEVDRYSSLFKTDEYVRMDVAHGPKVDVVGSADKMPFDDESFDSVVCTQVLEHVRYPVKSVTEIFRVLRCGGHAIITVPQTNELHEEPHDYFRYTKFGIDALFLELGFQCVLMKQRGGVFSVMGQQVIRYIIDSLSLYTHTTLGWFFAPFLAVLGRTSIFMDNINNTKANRKHAIGWMAVYKKP